MKRTSTSGTSYGPQSRSSLRPPSRPSTPRPAPSLREALAVVLSVTVLAPAVMGTGCAIVCGPVHTVPPQRLHVMAAAPDAYTIRVVARDGEKVDTPVPADGRVTVDVRIWSGRCTPYLFGFIKLKSATPLEKQRVIRVMRGQKVLRKLSADDIAKLPGGPDGYHDLMMAR